jgi:aspartate carbamoyltransferase catalytic subunit
VERWGLTAARLARACPEAWLLHPGPANEGVEITAELSTAPRSLIGRQVENGVPIRMAVLTMLATDR